jgi:hypothetical protein
MAQVAESQSAIAVKEPSRINFMGFVVALFWNASSIQSLAYARLDVTFIRA